MTTAFIIRTDDAGQERAVLHYLHRSGFKVDGAPSFKVWSIGAIGKLKNDYKYKKVTEFFTVHGSPTFNSGESAAIVLSFEEFLGILPASTGDNDIDDLLEGCFSENKEKFAREIIAKARKALERRNDAIGR